MLFFPTWTCAAGFNNNNNWNYCPMICLQIESSRDSSVVCFFHSPTLPVGGCGSQSHTLPESGCGCQSPTVPVHGLLSLTYSASLRLSVTYSASRWPPLTYSVSRWMSFITERQSEYWHRNIIFINISHVHFFSVHKFCWSSWFLLHQKKLINYSRIINI